tara:strand:- start:233 stop:640 length:408 start_codon:yes stop_codon:yes gene_type:complete
MRVSIFSLVIFTILCSCSKLDKKLDDKDDCIKLSGVHKFIYEPIVISDDCNCIVSGKVKYLKNCKTIALVDYGNGDCDNIATKILCKDGKCFDENKIPFDNYDYSINCNGENIEDGLVSEIEIAQLNDGNSGPQP